MAKWTMRWTCAVLGAGLCLGGQAVAQERQETSRATAAAAKELDQRGPTPIAAPVDSAATVNALNSDPTPGDAANADPQTILPPLANQPPKPMLPIGRWLDVQMATVGDRYRFISTSKDVVTNQQMQYSGQIKARVKVDSSGRYSVNVGLSTGNSFTGGWNDAGVGTPNDYLMSVFVKEVFVDAAPLKGIDFQLGGLYLTRGENTEITSYDNDGYVVGERVSVTRPASLFFDEISVTRGYFGDTKVPSVFQRYPRLSQTNYYQFLMDKRFGKVLSASVDYTTVAGVRTARGAIAVNAAATRVLDTIRFENYRRIDNPAYGFSIAAERAVTKRLTVSGGWADIDPKYGGLNADKFNVGRRLFTAETLAVTRDLAVQLFYQHALDNAFAVSNRQALQLVLTYNVLKALQHGGVL